MLPQHSTLTFPFLAREVVELGAIPLSLSNKETTELALHYMQKTDVLHLAESLYLPSQAERSNVCTWLEC